jgi:hypothetical protein
VVQGGKLKSIPIDDTLETDQNIKEYIDIIRRELVLSEEDF